MNPGPDPYRGLPAYQGSTPMEAPRPPTPPTVQNAYYAMLAGAVLQTIGIVVTLVQLGTLRDKIADGLRDNDPSTSQDTIDGVVALAVGFAIVFGLLYVGLWIWMAFANRAGKNWARITGTVFFGFQTLSLLASVISVAAGAAADNPFSAGSASVPSMVLVSLTWVVGLAAVILLWNKQSSAFFKPPAYSGGYAPPNDYGPQPGAY